MIIKGASVFCEDGTFQVKDVFVEDHKIVATEAEVSDKTVVDANGYKLIPGLVDVHSHGACGHDFCDCDVEGVKEILRFEKAHGITSYCPTSMTLSKEMLVDIFATAKEADGIADGARVIGINMEGPFIAPEKKGSTEWCLYSGTVRRDVPCMPAGKRRTDQTGDSGTGDGRFRRIY